MSACNCIGYTVHTEGGSIAIETAEITENRQRLDRYPTSQKWKRNTREILLSDIPSIHISSMSTTTTHNDPRSRLLPLPRVNRAAQANKLPSNCPQSIGLRGRSRAAANIVQRFSGPPRFQWYFSYENQQLLLVLGVIICIVISYSYGLMLYSQFVAFVRNNKLLYTLLVTDLTSPH